MLEEQIKNCRTKHSDCEMLTGHRQEMQEEHLGKDAGGKLQL
jgi:hypothetical protein